MEPKQITAEQAEQLRPRLAELMRYLGRIRERMDKAGLHRDELYPLVEDAYNTLHRLNVAVHYRSCKHGVGRPSAE